MRYKVMFSTERGSQNATTYVRAVSEKHAKTKLRRRLGDIVVVRVEPAPEDDESS